MVVACGLRLYGLDRQSLWYDEVVEEMDFQILLNRVFHNYEKTPDVTPPLNPFFVYLMTKVSPGSDFALRIPSFTFSLISVPLLFLLGRRLFNESVGLIAAFLLAISPFHIWYAQDARMYALQWMLSLISLLYFIRAVEAPDKKNIIGYSITTVAALYTHQFAVFLVLLQGIYILLVYRTNWQQIFKWAVIFFLVVASYVPWLYYSLTEVAHKAPGAFHKTIDYKLLMYTIYSYCAGFSIGPSLTELHFDRSWSVIKPYFFTIGSLMTVYCVPFIVGFLSVRKNQSKFLLLCLVLTVPILGAVGLVTVKPSIAYNARYTATALFAFLLFIAAGLERLIFHNSRMIYRISAVCVLIVMTGFSVYAYSNYQFDIKYHKIDIRGAVEYLNEKKKKDDLILCTGTPGKVFNRYSGGAFCVEFFPEYAVDDKEATIALMHSKIQGKERLWLVMLNEWVPHVGKFNYFAKMWLDNNYEELKEFQKDYSELANIRIYYYDLTRKKTSKGKR